MANNLPKHIDKITDPKRKAVAPYNFVELPDKVVEAQALPDGDRYYDHEEDHQHISHNYLDLIHNEYKFETLVLECI